MSMRLSSARNREAGDGQTPSRMISVRMTVAPIPIRGLLAVLQLRVIAIVFVPLPKIPAISAVFVVIPVVIVLVGAIVDACLFFVIPVVILRRGIASNRQGRHKCAA